MIRTSGTTATEAVLMIIETIFFCTSIVFLFVFRDVPRWLWRKARDA
jgi:hypothetical protein